MSSLIRPMSRVSRPTSSASDAAASPVRAAASTSRPKSLTSCAVRRGPSIRRSRGDAISRRYPVSRLSTQPSSVWAGFRLRGGEHPSGSASRFHRSEPKEIARMDKEQEKAAKARDSALQSALTQIERQFGAGSIMKMGDDAAAVKVAAVPTGALSLDLALGVGGLPRGRIVEIFGPESSGKTTLVYHVIAEAQARGGICAFIDAEHAM